MSTLLEKVIHGTKIRLVQGDITARDTDAIVNAANSHLKHYGGVAAAIVREGGKVIQDESDKIPFVPVGNVAVTTAGNLSCQAVIHAVGPRMGEGDEDEKLRRAISSILQVSCEHNYGSISVPAISSGIFGFPKDRCAKIILEEVIKYSKERHTNPKLVEICVFDDETLSFFRKEFGEV